MYIKFDITEDIKSDFEKIKNKHFQDIRLNKELYDIFLSLYYKTELTVFSMGGCSSCSNSSHKYINWRNKIQQILNMTPTQMKKNKTTFRLKDENRVQYVPYFPDVLTQNSPDSVAISYLNGASTDEQRKSREDIFEILPEDYIKKAGVKKAGVKKKIKSNVKNKK